MEAEDFRPGGGLLTEGCAGASGYCDADAGNNGFFYRPWESVDILSHWESFSDGTRGFRVGWTRNGEWLKYDIYAETEGFYRLTAAVSSGISGDKVFGIAIDDAPVAQILFNEDFGWNHIFEVFSEELVWLDAGHHELRLDIIEQGFDIDYVAISPP